MHPALIAGVPALVAFPEALPAPAVVWLHGLGADALANAAELERVAREGFVAVGLDAAGHGRRRLPDLDARIAGTRDEAFVTMLELADATAAELPAVLRALGSTAEVRGGVGLVGVSMGAYAAYRALTLGIRFRTAVALLGDPEWPYTGRRDRAAQARKERAAALARVPLLSITAERDESVPPGGVHRLHARLRAEHPDAIHRHQELAGAPHLMNAEDWARAMDWTVDWLRVHLRG